MPSSEIEKAKEIIAIAAEFKKENKEELLMLVAAADKLELTRKELETEKHNYKKSIYPIIKKNFRACLLFLSLLLLLVAAIYVPAHFEINVGSFKIEKSQTCESSESQP
jgi:hypothetical protein